MANPPTVITIRIDRDVAHEQVLKLRTEYSQAMANAYYALAHAMDGGGVGQFRAAARYAADAVKAKAQLRRIARWL